MDDKEFFEYWSKKRKKGWFSYVIVSNWYLAVISFISFLILKHLIEPEIFKEGLTYYIFSVSIIYFKAVGDLLVWVLNERKYIKLTEKKDI
jgi:hypothetical protein